MAKAFVGSNPTPRTTTVLESENYWNISWDNQAPVLDKVSDKLTDFTIRRLSFTIAMKIDASKGREELRQNASKYTVP